jgi:hypothetical protein
MAFSLAAREVSSSRVASREGGVDECSDEDAGPEKADEIAMTSEEGLGFGGFAVRA